MKDIKEIGEIKWCLPGILLEQEKCKDNKDFDTSTIHFPEILDILILKIDEMVGRINELSKRIA